MSAEIVAAVPDARALLQTVLADLSEGRTETAAFALRSNAELAGSAAVFRDVASIIRDYGLKGKVFHGTANGRRAVLSSRPLPEEFVRTLDETIAGVGAWLHDRLSYCEEEFPYLFVHVDPDYSPIPRTYLPVDRQAVRIGLHQAAVSRETLVHETTHGLSLVLDRFASELLAYHVEYSPEGPLGSDRERGREGNPTLKDVLAFNKDDLPDVYGIFFGGRQVSAQVTGQEQYLGYYLAYLYRHLEQRCGTEAMKNYFRQVDTRQGGEGIRLLFRECFGFAPDAIDRTVRASLLDHPGKTPRPEREVSDRYARDLGYDTVRLIDLKTYIKKSSVLEDADYLLRIAAIDFRLYTLSKKCGYINEHLLRKTSRTVHKVIELDGGGHAAWALRFRLLTEEVTNFYRNRDTWDGDLHEMGTAIADAVKTAHATVLRLDPECLETKLIDAQFHLFYPPSYQADVKKGLALLESLHAADPGLKDVYYYFAVHFHRAGKKAPLRVWMDKYESQFGKPMDTGFMRKPENL